MDLNELDLSCRYRARIKSSQRLTPEDASAEVRHLRLEIADPEFRFEVGQNVGVMVPGPHPFGNASHLRLYTIAGKGAGSGEIELCVRRCSYIDNVSGERYPGIASNFLCDRRPGESVELAGPYGSHFRLPEHRDANILMIGAGTGIAPFRAFVQRIYQQHGTWQGQVRLFYGAESGIDLLYMNDRNNDVGQYYTEDSFKAFEAISARPHASPTPALDQALMDNAEDVWTLLNDPATYVYLAGLNRIQPQLDEALAGMAGSMLAWNTRKQAIRADGRWAELTYD